MQLEMKKLSTYIIAGVMPLMWACTTPPNLEVNLNEKFDGQTIELINYLDSTVVASSQLPEGKALLMPEGNKPEFLEVVINGKVRAFYISEPGKAFLNDSTNTAVGTPLNDKFNVLLNQLDSVEQYDDMAIYLDFVEKSYNENKDNPIGDYFGVEWLLYANPEKVDSFLSRANKQFVETPVVKYYEDYSKLRAQTSPGKVYKDFEGEDENGKTLKLSDLKTEGKYTIIDFWASWCPYCIKELPDLKKINEKWSNKGVEIIGVAVRDLPEDTKNAVAKHDIPWKVLYNTGKRPYEIYGFSGIPHHILLGPDGTIISRDENVAQLEARLATLIDSEG